MVKNNNKKEIKNKDNKKTKVKGNKKTNDKLLIVLLVILAIIAVVLLVIRIVGGKQLDLEDDLVVELHNYFSTDDLSNCEGLFAYDDVKVNAKDVSLETKACLAYQKSDISNKTEEEWASDKKNSTCVQDDMIFKTEEDTKVCKVTVYDKNVLNDTYKKMYGEELTGTGFKVDNFHICYAKDDKYYCGLSETFTYTIGSESIIYRVMEKAVKKGSSIEIYDYFVKINENKCYNSYTSTTSENKECTKEYVSNKTKDIDYHFMEKYAIKYKHVYKKGDNKTYYWVSSEPLSK